LTVRTERPAGPRSAPKILLASYYFPPDSAVGGLRAAKFARSLATLGWVPYVITVTDPHLEQASDTERLKGLERVTIVRTGQLPTLADVYLAVKAQVNGFRRDRPGAEHQTGEPLASARRRENLSGRIKRYLVSLVQLLPDTKKNWSLSAAIRAVWLIRRDKIDYVLTSSPPASVHFVGLVARMLTNARWIADFRDPWLDTVFDRSPLTRSRASDTIENWMESSVVARADKVVTTTEALRTVLLARYPSVSADKFMYLPNSIDTEKFEPIEQVEKYVPLTITYAGTLYLDRTPEPLFQAVGDLLKAGRIRESDIRIKLIGMCGRIGDRDTRRVAKAYSVESIVDVGEPVSYSEAIRIMQKSHLLLVLAPARHRLLVGAKLFDYLGSGSRILAIAEPGATADLIRQTDSGICFSAADVTGMSEYLYRLIETGTFSTLKNDVESFRRYDVRNLTARLASEIVSLHPDAVPALQS
jgi:glycosyltransferase involved in cell wall biosynthesis